ncbi:MAG: HAMP domain-containing protein [Gammaproteobacteria bacterium]|nr:MAG: HAMP domain-containing protein [Gammaproteobacteria bacterium]
MHSLKTQIILALLFLTLLFSGAVVFAMLTVERQRQDDWLSRLGGELQVLQQHLGMQAMNYKENAPRDYPTYYRDTRLYYQDLLHARQRIGAILAAFAEQRLPPQLQSHHGSAEFSLAPVTAERAQELLALWRAFDATLQEKLGDPKEPRLEWASEWILAQHETLAEEVGAFLESLEHDLEGRADAALLFGRVILLTGIVLMLGLLGWFYAKVLRPLGLAVQGFRQVARGDFSHRVPVHEKNEIGWLVSTLNLATGRLDALLRLLTALQRSTDLDGALQAVAHNLPDLVPLDWVGILLLGADGRMRLERAYRGTEPDDIRQETFALEGTLLQECLRSNVPVHIADVAGTARLDSRYRFLGVLERLGGRDAVFMPVMGNEPRVGVLVLASRSPNAYGSEPLDLLNNLSTLFSATFGRTLELAENSRLAAIGQFTSGIVHEIRTPLATIGMALQHLAGLSELPTNSQRRAALALAESQRLERILEDILMYARPLALKRQTIALDELLMQLPAFGDDPRLHIDEDALRALPAIAGDWDRLTQVWINLLKNALEANGDDPHGVRLAGHRGPGEERVTLTLVNGGPLLSEEQLDRVFEPFYTTKSGGTGLGLPIVKRIVQAHGGTIEISANSGGGARVTLTLPLAQQEEDTAPNPPQGSSEASPPAQAASSEPPARLR